MAISVDLDPELVKVLLRNREDCIKIKEHGEKFIDQVITSLTIGLLGFTITFRDKFDLISPISIRFMKACWLLLSTSVALVAINNMLSIKNAVSEIQKTDDALRTKNATLASERLVRPCLSKIIGAMNWVVAILFLLGLGCLIVVALLAI